MTTVFSTIKRWATAIVCVLAIAFAWQGAFVSDLTANASPVLAARTDTGSEIQRENKSFVRDAAETVKDAARSNANRVEKASDNGSFVERKAQRDAGRIQQRADEDAARTQRAIDHNVNAIERTVDNIKDAFSK